MTVGVMLVAMWLVAVMVYLLWQFATNALGARAVPADELWEPAVDDASAGPAVAPARPVALLPAS